MVGERLSLVRSAGPGRRYERARLWVSGCDVDRVNPVPSSADPGSVSLLRLATCIRRRIRYKQLERVLDPTLDCSPVETLNPIKDYATPRQPGFTDSLFSCHQGPKYICYPLRGGFIPHETHENANSRVAEPPLFAHPLLSFERPALQIGPLPKVPWLGWESRGCGG